ncbi:uncharacterized protein ABDE67_003558 [Symphorus nematophorus]
MDLMFSLIGSCVDWDVKSLLLFLAVFILTADYIKNRRSASFPPGPWAFPIVGNILTVDYTRTHESLTQLADQYGDIYSLRMGQKWLVVLNRFEVLREALVTQGDSVADRPDLPLLQEAFGGLGVIFSNGNMWKQQRRFALSALRYFGFGKKSLEPVILDEFTHCAKYTNSFKGEPFAPHLIISNVVSNIICSLVFGHRFEYDDEKFKKLLKLFEKALQIEASVWAQLYNSFPLLLRCLPGPHKTVQRIWNNAKNFIREELKEHKQSWDPSDPRDYIDCYLNEIQTSNGQADSTFDEENLIICVLDLFVAGSETTSTTLRWAFLYMAKYPEIQAKVQAEIARVIGQSRQPSMDDRANMPYTNAVIHEVQRIGNIVPLSVPRVSNRDVQLGGYTVPKGVIIVPNLTSVLFDKNEWETPFTFNPGHFLNEEGNFVKRAAFIPFSAGKRMCLGENLARMELFLFFTSFMQHFTFSMPAGVKPVMDYQFGITLAPLQYEICARSGWATTRRLASLLRSSSAGTSRDQRANAGHWASQLHSSLACVSSGRRATVEHPASLLPRQLGSAPPQASRRLLGACVLPKRYGFFLNCELLTLVAAAYLSGGISKEGVAGFEYKEVRVQYNQMDSIFSVVGSYVDWDVKSLLLFMVIFILTADYIKNRRSASFPPGPWALPIVGNLFTVDHKKTHENMTQLADQYGDVYSLRMGQKWLVVLNRFEVLKEALVTQGDSLADRPDLPLQNSFAKGLGVIFSNGNTWKQQRRFALSTLRYFGFGKKSLEPVILGEFAHCAKEFNSFKGKPLAPHLILNNTVSNIICSLVFGHRFEYNDERFRKLMTWFDQSIQIEASIWAQLYNSFPLLMSCLPGPHKAVQQIWNDIKSFIQEELKEHRQNWDPSDPRDYIDCYLNEIQTTKGQADGTFDEENLIICVLDLFVAGSETTSTTLRWAFLYMAKYPEIQAKVQAEIDKVIGQSRQPSMDDRANLPYTNAVIHEVQRIGNIVPLSLPHFTNRDVQLGGYTVPKGVTIVPNLTSVLFDKNEWETPFTFNPGHFLNEEGNFVKRAAFIPFSAGKRVCLGENLARMELFLFFTSFMQHFTFSMPAGVKPVMDYRTGITLAPQPYEICATSRLE